VAAAYQVDRVRNAACNLAGWTVAYLKQTTPGAARDVAAREFAEGAITLAGFLIWNDLEIVGRGGWCSQARMGIALAYEIARHMPAAVERAVNSAEQGAVSLQDARTIAAEYATKKMVETSLEVVRLIPKLFDGPDGPTRREIARSAWRELHHVIDPPPPTATERLAVALDRLSPPAASKSETPAVVPTKGSERAALAERTAPGLHPAQADAYEELVLTLRKRRAPVRAAFIEFMSRGESASYEDLARHVHGNVDAKDATIRQNVKRVNKDMILSELPIRFRCSASYVFKDISPE
jgi:hypothetical protein